MKGSSSQFVDESSTNIKEQIISSGIISTELSKSNELSDTNIKLS